MLVRIQVILAIFIVSIAFGAETELQSWIIQLCAAADSTAVPGAGGAPMHLALVNHLALGLLCALDRFVVQEKEQDKIQECHNQHDPSRPAVVKQLVDQQDPIENPQPLGLDRDNAVQAELPAA